MPSCLGRLEEPRAWDIMDLGVANGASTGFGPFNYFEVAPFWAASHMYHQVVFAALQSLLIYFKYTLGVELSQMAWVKHERKSKVHFVKKKGRSKPPIG